MIDPSFMNSYQILLNATYIFKILKRNERRNDRWERRRPQNNYNDQRNNNFVESIPRPVSSRLFVSNISKDYTNFELQVIFLN